MQIGKDYIGVGVGAFIVNENNELLLLKRKKSPEKDYWSIPGGKVELFEKIENAVIRELKEELGIDIEIIELLGICNHIILDEEKHWVSPSYLCRIVKGVPKKMEPMSHEAVQWFNINNLPENITITTKNALAGFLNKN